MYKFIFILLLTPSIYPQCDSLYKAIESSETHYDYVENSPIMIDGFDSLYSRLVYPKEALVAKNEGKVYVMVIIDSTGSVMCPEIIKGIGFGCDEEAIRLVTTTKFTPAYYRGKPKTIRVSIPVLFKIPKE